MTANRPTTQDLWDVSNRIEEKLDKKFEALEARIRNIESYQNKAIGIISIIGTFVSIAAAYIWNKVIGN